MYLQLCRLGEIAWPILHLSGTAICPLFSLAEDPSSNFCEARWFSVDQGLSSYIPSMRTVSVLELLGSGLAFAVSFTVYKYTQASGSASQMVSVRTLSLEARLFNPTLYSQLLKLWFEGLPRGATTPSEQLQMRWFGLGQSDTAKASFDHDCRSGFEEALRSISPAKFILPAFTDHETDRSHFSDIAAPFLGQFYHGNSGDPDAALGLSLLLDQIPRNIFREDQALIYGHYDRIARAVFYAIHAHQLDQHERYFLSPVHRSWFYMPLMHSESINDHKLAIHEMEDFKSCLEAKGDESAAQHVGQTLSFEKRHFVVIEKFGRYPHRNKCLGREMTEKEQKWLEEGGDTFGT
jgi:uncharacterized protein (DUF924 family)